MFLFLVDVAVLGLSKFFTNLFWLMSMTSYSQENTGRRIGYMTLLAFGFDAKSACR